MRLSTRLSVSLACVLLPHAGSALPVGQEQQPVLLIEDDLLNTVPYTQHLLQSTIRDVLLQNNVIGDVLDDFEPSYYLDISYPKSHETVLLGNDIPVKSVSSRPVFTFHPIDEAYSPSRRTPKKANPASPPLERKQSIFTLILTDPDATSRENPKWSEMCHWILTNLTTPAAPPPRDLPQLLKAKAGEIEEYLPPGPPPKTGAHRYVFVLLEGDSSHLNAPAERKHWGYDKPRRGVRDWAQENELSVVGANFFFAQNEKQ